MPMNEGAHAGFVCKIDTEPLAGGKTDTRTSVRPDEPEDLGRPAIHFERARSGDEALRSEGCGARRGGQHPGGEGGAEKTAARDGGAHGRLVSVMSP
jgi:hypothetical protein